MAARQADLRRGAEARKEVDIDRSRHSAPVAELELSSFDGGVRRVHSVVRPDRYRMLEALPPHTPRTVRGGGYSYAPASFGADATVQDVRAFDRCLAIDEVERTVTCEAGMTLGKLYALGLPRALYMPIQPGYPAITIGGCIAADVHGKNHHKDGNFRNRVRALTLYHPEHGVMELSRESNSELFDLTCGGFGLTGQILNATLTLERVPARSVQVLRSRIERVEDTVRLLDECAPRAELAYTWQDFTATGASFGRGFLFTGTFADTNGPGLDAAHGRVRAIDSKSRGRRRFAYFNRATTRAFNSVYHWIQGLGPDERAIPLFDFLFPVARKVVYYELFGARGLHEYQVLIPAASFGEFTSRVRNAIAKHRMPITLASCKLFRGERSLVRFDGTGVCIALDFPRSHASAAFAAELDEALLECGGIPNVIKDSRLPRTVMERAYPEHAAFREGLRRFDPERLYRSEISERLGL